MFRYFKKKKIQTSDGAYQDKWTIVALKGVEQYNLLTPSERIWYNIRGIIDSTNNGGLISYYYNSGAENVYDAIEDLENLGFDNISLIIKKYNQILFNGDIVPKNLNERNNFVNSLSEQRDELLQDLEFELTKQIDDLENKLTSFLEKEKMIK
ncbi:MAG: DUF4375 domain-containing protein [Bacteroidales bacterium]|nr:DUF4375 domain-containing protein [Bacteroidales bacterium]